MQEQFKILSARDHARTRIGMYMGSANLEQNEQFVNGEWRLVTYVPAINKMISEILDNSIDEAIRTQFSYANRIDISIQDDWITVTDNGRGIPQDLVEVSATGEKILRPVAAWTLTNAGTSFTEDRTTIGANGVGASVTGFLSSEFIGETWQNNQMVKVHINSHGDQFDIVTSTSRKSGNGTQVKFTPDFNLFELKSLSEHDTIALIEDRISGLQLAFPEIVFSFNKKRIQTNTLKKYAELFTDGPDATVISCQTDDLLFFVCSSVDGFRSNSFVNGVNTRLGGSYVDFIINGIVDELTTMIKRKYKIDVVKSTIKGGMTFIKFARNFTDARYDSQTKERLTSPLSQIKSHYINSDGPDFKKLAKKILAADDIIMPIVEAQIAKKAAADNRDAKKEQKKLKRIKVAKHIPASTRDATLFLMEGDSAVAFFPNVRDPKKAGAYPLGGVVRNTWMLEPNEVLKNKEMSEVISILGLDIMNPDSVDNMNYQYIATLTDADYDGNHIAALLMAFFYKFWPRLFTEGRVMMTRTPIMITQHKKKDIWSYTYEEAHTTKSNHPKADHRYIKGLGLLQEAEYSVIINDPVMDVVTIDEAKWFEVMFGKDTQPRKEWLTNNIPTMIGSQI